jgi:hypothetical protein
MDEWTWPSQMTSIIESIQPQVPLRLPCYDFTSVTNPTVVHDYHS